MKPIFLVLVSFGFCLGALQAGAAEREDAQVGAATHALLLRTGLKLSQDPAHLARVERVGRALEARIQDTVIPPRFGKLPTKPFPFRFFVVADEDVNAFALPGGYVYVNTGILGTLHSDDELAGVMGHEMTHSWHRHGIVLDREEEKSAGRSNLGMAGVVLGSLILRLPVDTIFGLFTLPQLLAAGHLSAWSRNAERDADAGGVLLMRAAGYDPVGELTMLETLAMERMMRPEINYGIYATHPLEMDRVRSVKRQIEALGLPIHRRATNGSLALALGSAEGCTALSLAGRRVLCAEDSPVRAFAAVLDRQLDGDLRLHEVRVEGAQLVVADTNRLSLESAEAAARAQRAIRFELWAALLRSPQTFETAGDRK